METFKKYFLKNRKKENSLYFIGIIILGIFSGIPYSVTIMSRGVSVNYLYFIFFIIFLFKEKFFFKKNLIILITLSYFIFIFSLNFINLKIDFILFRKISSFIVFIAPFFFFIFIVKKKTIESFKYAIIITSIFYGLLTIYWYYEFLYHSTYTLGFQGSLKHYVGGSRMGFFHIVAFYLILEKIFTSQSKIYYLILFINTAAIYNTYSRTTLIALIISNIFFIVICFINRNLFINLKKFLIIFLIILLNTIIFTKTTKHYNQKLYSIIANTITIKGKDKIIDYLYNLNMERLENSDSKSKDLEVITKKLLKEKAKLFSLSIPKTKDQIENFLLFRTEIQKLKKSESEKISLLVKDLEKISIDTKMSTKQKKQKKMELENKIKEIEKNINFIKQVQNKLLKIDNQLKKSKQLKKKDKYLEFSNPKSSEGYRLLIWKKTFDYLLENNLLFHGSGYIGTFIVDNKMKFSAHSQYVDTLFRTGVIGLIITFVIYIKLLLKFYKTNCYMFSSLIGVLVYGLLHETFKQSQGGFILMFYIISYLHENYKSKVYSE